VHIIVIGLLLAIAPILYSWLCGHWFARVLVFLVLAVVGFFAGANSRRRVIQSARSSAASSALPDHARGTAHQDDRAAIGDHPRHCPAALTHCGV
jgi:hypothetical protein